LTALGAGGLCGIVSQGYSQVYTLSDLNSSAKVNVGNQSGMFNWSVDNINVLNQQWFWLGIGNSAPMSIDQISAANVSQPSANLLDTTYTSAAHYSVGIEYLLTGSTPGTGSSDMGESITLSNGVASTQVFHFYEYSDFNLGPLQVVQLGKNLQGRFNLADVEDNSNPSLVTKLSETVATPGANHGEAELAGVTLAKLNNGVLPVTLNDSATTAGPGPDTTWAFEWDISIAPGQEYLISKDKAVQITFVPEPTIAALALLGFGVFGLRKRLQNA
jgi:hypothetical protein